MPSKCCAGRILFSWHCRSELCEDRYMPNTQVIDSLCFFSQFYILAKNNPKLLFFRTYKWSVALFPMLASNSEKFSKVLGLQISANMPGPFLKLSNRDKWIQFSTMSHTFGTQTNVSYLLQQLWVLMLRLVQSKPSSILKLNASILFLAPSYIVTPFSVFSFCFVLCVSVCVCIHILMNYIYLYNIIYVYTCIIH